MNTNLSSVYSEEKLGAVDYGGRHCLCKIFSGERGILGRILVLMADLKPIKRVFF